MAQQQTFKMYDNPQDTLLAWTRILNHLTNNLNNNSYITIAPNTIKASMINFGTGTDEVDASDIPNTPSGSISSSTVQLAINELDSEKQPKDETLTALANLDSTKGIVVQTGTDTFTKRTIVGTNNQVVVTNGTGESGDPTLSLPQDIHTGANPTFANITASGLSKGATGHFGGSSNYSEFESDGTLKFNGDATVWEDIDFPIIIRLTGANIPTLEVLQGNITAPQWQVDDYNICEGQELIHQWKEGSRVYWHIHIITNGVDTTDRFLKWEVEWFWVNVDGQLSASDTQSVEYTIPANTPTKTMKVISIYDWIPIGGKITGHVYARLKRIASTGTAPTNNPWCTMLQLHVECDTLGSRTISLK